MKKATLSLRDREIPLPTLRLRLRCLSMTGNEIGRSSLPRLLLWKSILKLDIWISIPKLIVSNSLNIIPLLKL